MPLHLFSHRFIDAAIGWRGAEPRIRAQLLELFCAGIRMRSLVGNVAALLLVGGFVIAGTPTPTHIGWLAAVISGGLLPRFYAARLRAQGHFEHAPERKALCFMALNALYGLLWGAGPLILLPALSGNATGVLFVLIVLGTIMGPYAAMPGILYTRLATTGGLTLLAIALCIGLEVSLISSVIAFWLVLRTDIWRSYHRALRDQLELQAILESRQRRLQQANHEKEEANRRLKVIAGTDPLTGAGNRRQLVERLETLHGPAALILFDIDHFKTINDRFGHQAGDALLQQIVRITDDMLTQDSLLVRLGGDEFAILMPATDAQGALRQAEDIRGHIAWHPLPADNKSIRVTVSLGVAAIGAEVKSINAGDLLSEADTALYAAKRRGRNQSGTAAGTRRDQSCAG